MRIEALGPRCLMVLWCGLAGLLLAGASLLLAVSPHFEWHREVIDMPAAGLGFGLFAAGCLYALLVPLIGATELQVARRRHLVLVLGIGVGAAARLILMYSEPALEDDYNRYLWEGALTAHLINPYAVTPDAARRADPASPIGHLAAEGSVVLARVNHPHLTSTYPPVAQLAFAIAHVAAPWNLDGWRLVVLTSDAVTLVLLLRMLPRTGRSRLWSLLYWWNPLVLKEFANSAHMDAVIVVLVMAALCLATERRPLGAAVASGLAIGTKLWPMFLAPLILRPDGRRPTLLLTATAIVVVLAGIWLVPIWFAGPSADDGFAAYARLWRTNSAAFPLIERGVERALAVVGQADMAWKVAGGIAASALVAVVVWQVRRPIIGAADLTSRATVVVTWLVLLSPAQFPWYVTWVVPLAAFEPRWSIIVMTATTPLYYVSFHLIARDRYDIFADIVVWIIWVPVWLAAALDVIASRRMR